MIAIRRATEYHQCDSLFTYPCHGSFHLLLQIVHALWAVWAIQALVQGNTESYFGGTTDRLSICLVGGTLYTMVHAALLFRLRIYFTGVTPLKWICAWNVITHLSWLRLGGGPSNLPVVFERIQLAVRIILIVNFLLGYSCAGQAQGVSTLLTSEKEE